MAVTIPTTTGKADWTNYQDYWREEDAEYLQARSILRYATSAARLADWATPQPGQVTYNAETDQLEHFTTATPTKWIGVLASQHLWVTPITSANATDPVVLGHRGALGGGLQFFPTVASENKIAMPSAFLDIGTGKIVAKATGLTVTGVTTALATTTIKTGTKTATLTTSATDLVSDSPFTAPSATITNIAMSGTLSGAGVVNGASGTIGNVQLSGNAAYASSGFISSAGYFMGDASAAYVRQRNTTTGATTANYIRVDSTNISATGDLFDIHGQLRLFGSDGGIQFYNAAATVYLGSSGPVIVGGSPDPASYPAGTIWAT